MRPLRVRTLFLALASLTAACQDYNFNPVGHCLIQPGQKRVTLSNLATADVLFVIDDSGSMGGEQQKLADNFAAFVSNLNQANVERRAAGLEPIDFHLAVTTTSVFTNNATNNATCRNDCPTAVGQNLCCEVSGTPPVPVRPMRTAKTCTATSECTSGATCSDACPGFLGEKICCNGATIEQAPVACTSLGSACGKLDKHYRVDPANCAPGVAVNGALYPHGAFVGFGTNPRVIHFDKELYPAATDPQNPACAAGTVCNKQGYTAAQLETWFKQNVVAGTCGSGQEQGLQAGRLAVQKALAKAQPDNKPDGTAIAADWPHDDSKLVLVFLGDEDDCSSPEDPVGGIIMTSFNPGADSCVADAGLPDGTGKHFAVSQIVDYFSGLGRPLGAAFIVSANSETCEDQSCVPGQCCDYACSADQGFPSTCRTDICGGQGASFRLLEAADQLRQKGADVVVGSMCNPNFGTILSRVADIVKPPAGLVLPSEPAGSDITIVRIADETGKTRKTCKGPAPATLDAAQANTQGYDWWFTATRDQLSDAQRHPSAVSKFIYINHATRNCEANPGETYSADYLGRLPASGCVTRADCYAALGGVAPPVRTDQNPELWTCFAGANAPGSPTPFVSPTGTTPGTCLCGDLGAGSF
jgi:hypothetical protein